jgi:DNA-directed RNA polymerase subunit omega
VASVIFRSFAQTRSRPAADKEKSQPAEVHPFMHSNLLKSASIVIPDSELLINVVRQRVRQLIRGHRPLVEVPPGTGYYAVALSEVIARKLSYELAPGVKPDSSFASIVTFPRTPSEKKAA